MGNRPSKFCYITSSPSASKILKWLLIEAGILEHNVNRPSYSDERRVKLKTKSLKTENY